MPSFYLNNTLYSVQTSAYNLDVDILDGISLYIAPKTFSTSVSGYNEVANNTLWLLKPKADTQCKVRAVIGGIQVDIKEGLVGESSTNPYVFRRTSSPSPISVIEDSVQKNIYPVYGNDSTQFGTDWIRKINIGNNSLSEITSLASSANIEFNKTYLNNHLINKNLNDFVTFNIVINETNGTQLYNLIVQQLLECTFVIHKTVYNKNITSGLDYYNQTDFKKFNDNEFGIRF
jgi:hypothetical protein